MILNVQELEKLRPNLKGRIIATNGCFDILHCGHVELLEVAKNKGDILIVGLNSDASVKLLKGKDRPINPEHQRAFVLKGLRAVDHVCIFEGMRCVDFLLACKPDVYVKGGDYTLETLDAGERDAVGAATILFMPITKQVSTSEIIRKLAKPFMAAIP